MSFENELGQPLLPGFEQDFAYYEPRGHGSGQTSSQTENWYTHVSIIELTEKFFYGQIDLDPMSCSQANQMVNAKVFYTAEQDGLTRPWYGNILWNPPWHGSDANSAKRRGVKKLLDAYNVGEVKNAVCVLNANALTTAWIAPLLDFPVCVPPKRIPHYGPNGEGGAPNSGTVVIGVTSNVGKFAEVFGSLGRIMIPYIHAPL